MDQTEKDTSSGREIREYKCSQCGHSDWEDRGKALWQILHDDREEFEAAKRAASNPGEPIPASPASPPATPSMWSRFLAIFTRQRGKGR